MSAKPISGPLSLCMAKWVTTEPNNSHNHEIVTNTWSDGFLQYENAGCSLSTDQTEAIVRVISIKQNIPIISFETPVILFDYYKNKYRAFLVPSGENPVPITKEYSSFITCAKKTVLIAEALDAPILVSDRNHQIRKFQFPTIFPLPSPSKKSPIQGSVSTKNS